MTVHFLDLKIRSDKEKLTFLRDAYPAEESNISELIKEFQDLRHEHDALMADIKELKEWHNIHIIYRVAEDLNAVVIAFRGSIDKGFIMLLYIYIDKALMHHVENKGYFCSSQAPLVPVQNPFYCLWGGIHLVHLPILKLIHDDMWDLTSSLLSRYLLI
ncbi:hypothetical protein M9H77_17363 [Catharanthus roseus]|uniref:Uncharacterized protein n=1 Tax=Catharanthus roseus TaxID=4058 RepID=A0ACC0B4D0_CATRO|nr:hypothetical protein M9H77_17363 [Catharanthus roseus]